MRLNPSKLNIETQNAKLEIHQEHAKISIETKKPKLEIDQYEAFASSGLKNMSDLTKEAADRGKQQVLEFIGKEASDGHMLASIENGGNPIAEIAKRDSSPEKQFGMVTMPSVGPKFKLIPGEIKIRANEVKHGEHIGYEANYIPGKVNINYTSGKLEIYLKKKPSIEIKYIDERR